MVSRHIFVRVILDIINGGSDQEEANRATGVNTPIMHGAGAGVGSGWLGPRLLCKWFMYVSPLLSHVRTIPIMKIGTDCVQYINIKSEKQTVQFKLFIKGSLFLKNTFSFKCLFVVISFVLGKPFQTKVKKRVPQYMYFLLLTILC